MADWVKFRVDRLTDEQQQASLDTEYGGMNDVLANLYAVTGNADYLQLARKFDHQTAVRSAGRAAKTSSTACMRNTQIPEGDRRRPRLRADGRETLPRHRDVLLAARGASPLVRHRRQQRRRDRSFPVDHFRKHLGPTSTETCNTYNMLKLTRHLFAWEPSAETMDFYERGLYNHILASQDPATGMMSYYVPLRPGAFKTYSTPDDSFWCCVGTGMENHAKYGDTIYFHDDRSLFSTCSSPRELTWKEKGLVVRQETRFPEEDATRLIIQCSKPVRLALKIRVPAWALSGIAVAINGQKELLDAGRAPTPSSTANGKPATASRSACP